MTQEASVPPDHPDLPVKPPIIFVIALAAGVAIHWVWPMSARPASWGFLGIGVSVLAIALIEWASFTFRRSGTNVVPWKPAMTVVSRGPYALSRNPISVGFALFQVGLGLWTNRLAVVLMVVPAVIVTGVVVIRREERYLERKFGAAYLEYKTRVRRWV